MIDLNQAEDMLSELSLTIPLGDDRDAFARRVGIQALRILYDHEDDLYADARAMLEDVYSEVWGVKPMRFPLPDCSS